jgi:hypothetical protein
LKWLAGFLVEGFFGARLVLCVLAKLVEVLAKKVEERVAAQFLPWKREVLSVLLRVEEMKS